MIMAKEDAENRPNEAPPPAAANSSDKTGNAAQALKDLYREDFD